MSEPAATPPPARVPILGATPRLVAVDKPAWMLSVPGKGPDKQDCVAARVRAMFPRATGPLVVHRLDMETSGVMVFALDAEAQRELSMQFERREVEKTYVALVRGDVAGDEGAISLPLRADIENRPFQIVDHERGQPSVTKWRVLERDVEGADAVCTRIEFTPLTGRTHQIRVHAAAPRPGGLGAPIVGDSLYGPEHAGARERGERPERLMLHAATLSVTEPGTGARLRFSSRVPF